MIQFENVYVQGPREPTVREHWLASNKGRLTDSQLYNFGPIGGGEGAYTLSARHGGLSVDGKRLREDERRSVLMSFWASPRW